MEKIKLYEFNNLTKTLSFNIYDICYAKDLSEKKKYIEYIDEKYNSDKLTSILKEITNIIGANVLNVAKQDYEPEGASVNVLISEEPLPDEAIDKSCNQGVVDSFHNVLLHLDKSHISAHTYPESHPEDGIMTFRVDLDVSTCGMISPLKALNYLFDYFDSDIIICDYKVRGFTRDIYGNKHYMDHNINSIQDYIDDEILDNYINMDMNIYSERLFHTKMMLEDIDLNNYLFDIEASDLSDEERESLDSKIRTEMLEIYYGKNNMGE